ncbi:MAG TPA: ribosome small subunit-dependent GTPase A [Bacilli bacterium]|nr:ribosome small subunit-dependent GTPase A [Bacilli bacterium]
MQGRIIKQISNQYTVRCDDEIKECSALGKFRNDKITPMVGDYVIIDDRNNQIIKILPRKNELKRPVIANVDRALIITSAKEPKLSFLLLDKMLSLVIHNSIKPLICITKIDLLTRKELRDLKKIKRYYHKIGIKVFFNNKTNKLKRELKNKTVVLVGQSGAGKSTLLNKLDKTLNLKTSPISKSLGRGIHTTRHTELFQVGDILVADTPGFSSLSFENISEEELSKTFLEFKKCKCKFKNCLHINENDCEVKKLVEKNKILPSRYTSYLKIIKEIGDNK